jgi:serine/threonine protein kinase
VNNGESIGFGRYQLVERLAVGGMAELYRAVLPGPSGFSKPVAIKKILPALNRHDRFRKMFLHEGRIMAALSHRNIVQVFELGEVDGELYMSLEYVPGCDLAKILDGNKENNRFMDPAMAAWIAREVCRGLAYVHNLQDDQGQPMHVVHRDVNPNNILLSRHGDVKLGDFGIAKSLVGEVLTSQGQLKGKLEYLSPEQARGDSVAPTSDVYAVGLVLYEMLASQRYIQGIGDADLLKNAARPLWRPISLANPGVPQILENLVKRALRTEPDKRFASASAFADALTEIIEAAPQLPSNVDLACLVMETCDSPEVVLVSPSVEETAETDVQQIKKKSTDLAERLIPEGIFPEDDVRPHTVSLAIDPADLDRKKKRNRSLLIIIPAALLVLIAAGAALWFFVFSEQSGPEPIEQVDAIDPEPITPPPDIEKPKPKPQPKPKPRPKPKPKTLRSRAELNQELSRQRQRLKDKGVRTGDVRQVDRLLARVRKQIRRNDRRGAEKSLHDLDVSVDSLQIDKKFVERKLLRLQKALARAKREPEFAKDTEKILNHAINNRFAEANAGINGVFDRLRRKKRSKK